MSTKSSRRRKPESLASRVQRLVNDFAQGSVRGAAELWDIQRLTLLRLIKGQVRNPRGPVLEQIAEACGTDVEWLRTGKGAPPIPPSPTELLMTPWQGRWRRLVEELGLTEEVRERVVALPGLMTRVFYVMVLAGHPVGKPIRGMEVARRGEEFEYRAWVALLTGLVDTYGKDRVREKLEAERLWLDLQFNPVAVSRYVKDGVGQRSKSDPVRLQWEEDFRLAHEGSPWLPVQSPSLATE
jgi:hypothetical protein